MIEFIAALVSSSMAIILNRWALPKFGMLEILWLGPVGEEFVKTGAAWLWGASIPTVHILFGVIEALLDLRSKTACRYYAAVASVSGHALFGYATIGAAQYWGSLVIGLCLGIVLHICWNGYVMAYVAKHRSK
jgi:hypothetical protein